MLDQYRKRWADVVQMLCKCFMFAGMAVAEFKLYAPHPTSAKTVHFFNIACSFRLCGTYARFGAAALSYSESMQRQVFA